MSENESNIASAARTALEKLLSLVGVSASVEPLAEVPVEEEEATTSITLNIEGEDLGILIGRRGQTLASLQYIVRLIVGHQTQQWLPIIIDVHGYKRRRNEALQALAQRIAEQVKVEETPFALEPMMAYERRIIHITLANDPDVATQSSGEGEARRVVILPREQLT